MPKTNAVITSKMDGNAFFIIGAAINAMKKVGVSREIINEYKKDAISGDYDHLLQVTMEYVEIE